MSSVEEFDDELLDAIANDYISEKEMGSHLMNAAINDKDWPYVAGLILMGTSYRELSSHESIQLFIRRVLADWGAPFDHDYWMGLDQPQGQAEAAKAIKKYNAMKRGDAE